MNKILHVRDGRVAAISIEGESVLQHYGQLHAVPYQSAYQVGSPFPLPEEEPTMEVIVTAAKATIRRKGK